MRDPVVASELITLVRTKNDFAERKTTIVMLAHDSIDNVEKVVMELEQVNMGASVCQECCGWNATVFRH